MSTPTSSAFRGFAARFAQIALLALLALAGAGLAGCASQGAASDQGQDGASSQEQGGSSPSVEAGEPSAEPPASEMAAWENVELPDGIPAYSGQMWVELDNGPTFSEADRQSTAAWEHYGELDELGRVTTAEACIGLEIMPTEERGDISSVHPTGWVQHMYLFVDGESLYNRSHLIGYALAAENDNELNLMTGTRSMNLAMIDFEEEVGNYVHRTGGYVLYRVTPVFVGNELVARGVKMEAYSVADAGASVSFSVFVYNVEPGVVIDYATGENWESDPNREPTPEEAEVRHYVVNVNSGKVHLPECDGARDTSAHNRLDVEDSLANLKKQGYEPCGGCL